MMNCRQVEKLLPLYISSDLEAPREQLVIAHVQSCPLCSAVAAEYRQTHQLLQEFAPPAFSDSVYADIRQGVWREIEAEAAVPSIVDLIAGGFRPRLSWAVATAALIVVSMLGIYFVARPKMGQQEVNLQTPSINPNVTKNQVMVPSGDSATPSPVASNGGLNRPRQVYMRHFDRRSGRRRAPDRVDNLVVHAPDASALPSAGESLESIPSSESQSGKTLRMELQTRDPNIRIIWFVPRNTKPVSTGLKGT